MSKYLITTVTTATLFAGVAIANPPAYSGRILYQKGNDGTRFEILDIACGTVTSLALPDAHVPYSVPQWCQSGDWITIVGYGAGPNNSQIFALQSDGSQFASLTPGDGNYVMPSFSADCEQIVFHQVYGSMLRINRDGTGFTDLGVPLGHTRWSPVDNRITCTDWGTFTYESNIFVFDMDAGTTTQITSHGPGRYFNYAAWSPDGQKLAVVGGDPSGTSDIFVMNADGTNVVNITSDWSDSSEHWPAWSPDGSFIVFQSDRLGGHLDIWAMRPDGTERVNLTNTPDVDESVPTIAGAIDLDHDGVPDCDDKCPNSEDSDTIVINGCETGVDNGLFEYGCSMLDLIDGCESESGNHGQFVRCVSALARDWRQAGLINNRDRASIIRCVAGIPHGHVNPKAMRDLVQDDVEK